MHRLWYMMAYGYYAIKTEAKEEQVAIVAGSQLSQSEKWNSELLKGCKGKKAKAKVPAFSA
jgi:hypothetical protein